MTITLEQQEQMFEAAKPLIKWLNENCHPYCTALVDQASVELVAGIASVYKLPNTGLSGGRGPL